MRFAARTNVHRLKSLKQYKVMKQLQRTDQATRTKYEHSIPDGTESNKTAKICIQTKPSTKEEAIVFVSSY